MKKKLGLVKFIAPAAVVLGVGTFVFCMDNIRPGYVGVVYSLNGGIQNEVLTQGRKFVMPWHKVNQYSVATEQAYLSKDAKEGSKDDDSFMIPTSDGKTVNVDLEFSYHFDVDRLPETFTKFKGQSGKQIEQTFIRGKMKAWTSEASSKFSVLDIYGEKRSELNAAVLDHVKSKFNEYGIVIDSVNFSRIELDQQTAEAIQVRINKQQELEAEKLETQKQEEVNARKEALAESEAKIKLKEAEAEAEANKKLAENLNKNILEKKAIDKWNGELPDAVGGNSIINKNK